VVWVFSVVLNVLLWVSSHRVREPGHKNERGGARLPELPSGTEPVPEAMRGADVPTPAGDLADD
jgi:hypothetical protein